MAPEHEKGVRACLLKRMGTDAVVAAEGGLVIVLNAHPLCCEWIGASFDPRFFVADAVRAFFVLLFLSADHDNVGLDLPVGVDRCSCLILAFCEVLRLRRKPL